MNRRKRNKTIAAVAVCAACVLLLSGFAFAYHRVNSAYPAMTVHTVEPGEYASFPGGQEIKVVKWELATVERVRDFYPAFMTEEAAYKWDVAEEDMRNLLVTIRMKVGDESSMVAFSDLNASAGTWRNGVDYEVVQLLNKGALKDITKTGEEVELLLLYNLFKHQFPADQWEKIGDRQFELICLLYPEKYVFQL